ncbi:MAG: hypothetical protein AAGA42_09105 [Actinomycetota bacterium]
MAAVPAARILSAPTFVVRRRRGTVGELHAALPSAPPHPELWRMAPTASAVVLGSSQPDELIDFEAAQQQGVSVVQRHSGGGAVLVDPATTAWFDAIIPADAPGWSHDIHRPMRWLGERLAAAFRQVDPGLAAQVQHEVVDTPWSRLLCFDGLGVGELTVDGHKLVGMSQRRTREYARVQCSWYQRNEQSRLVGLLSPEHRPPIDALAPVATLPATELDDVLDALAPLLV